MSYYDSTVASYDSQIGSNNTTIDNCYDRIRQLEDDIDELKKLKIKVGDVDEAVANAVSNTSNKINRLPSVIVNPFSFLKLNYFSNFFDVLNGPEHKNAKNSIDNAVKKIDKQISNCQTEIENLRGEITRCNNNIRTLTTQKNNYIAAATAPKPEPAKPQPQVEKKEEPKKASSTSKKTSSKKNSSKKKK